MNRLILVVVAAGFLSGCGGQKAEAATCDSLPSNVTYTNKVKAFLESNCTQCHSSANTNPFARRNAPTGVDYDSYDAAKKNAAAGADATQNGEMPEGKTLSDEDKCLMRAWVSQNTPQ